MRILVLGGTGSIGSAIVEVLLKQGHQVVALGRSRQARTLLQNSGATPIEGDLNNPSRWVEVVENVDAVIQAAAAWGDDMGKVDRLVVDALLEKMHSDNSPKALIYTGGCWLYGRTGDTVATEETAFDPLDSFDWTIPTIQTVLSTPYIRGMVIHPAMVYERNGGVFEHIFKDAKELGYVRVIGGENIRWPLVHRMDLAELYVLMLEQGKQGDVYNAAAIDGVYIGDITRVIAKRLGINTNPVVLDVDDAKSEFGSWADGYALDQQMSGQKAMEQLGWRPKHLDVMADIA